jgi:glutaryl-CoA dehydrogenase
MATIARKKGENYVLNGQKMWITNGTIADMAVIWAKLDGEIRGFIVEADRPGFRATPIKRKFSYRTSPTAFIDIKNCEIPQTNILPKAIGLKSIFQCLNHARYGVAWGALGSSIACYQEARNFAVNRKVFDRPVASYQLVQDQLTRMLVEITKAQLISFHLGRMLDDGQAKPSQISLAKLNNVREAINIAHLARDIIAARGILADHHVIRHLCDLEAVSTLEGTAGMHTLILGQEITGIQAFK